MYSTYIFDLDGTLLDTLQDLAASTNYALRTQGYPEHTIDEVRMMVGNGVEKLIRRAVPQGTSESDTLATLDVFRKHYLIHSEDSTAPYEGIIPLLQRLKGDGKHIAVVSNKFDAATKKLCEKYFPGLIDIAVGEDESNGIRKKPNPDTVLKVLETINDNDTLRYENDTLRYENGSNYQSDETPNAVYIGDSDVDLETAKNSNLPCISVLWGFRSKQFLIDHGATTFVEHPEEILKMS